MDNSEKVYTATVEDTNDGSGDGILTFDPEFIKEIGWKEGDTIKMKVEDGKLYLSKVESD